MVSTFLDRARKQQLAASGISLAVDSVAVLFNAERWVTKGRAVGGILAIAPGRNEIDPLLELGPTFPLAEPANSPRRRLVEHLRRMLSMPGARDRVIDYLARVEASRGWG